MLVVKALSLLVLIFISIQDIKSRLVYWFLFPTAAICMSTLFFTKVTAAIYFFNVVLNLSLIAIILIVLYVYASIKLRINFWKEAFGLGDALFFVAFALSFPTVSFIVLFVAGLIFSLLISFFVLRKDQKKTVPLAGFMAVYLLIVFLVAWSCSFNLYLL